MGGPVNAEPDAEIVLAALAGQVPDIGDTFTHTVLGQTGRYRVAAWLRRRPPRAPDPDPRMEELLRDLETRYPRRGAGPDNVPLEFCRRWEAEYVEGHGVGGVIVRVADVRVTGRVQWSKDLLDGERKHAELIAGEPVW